MHSPYSPSPPPPPSSAFDLPKLHSSGANYTSWLHKPKVLLRLRNLWQHVDPSGAIPPFGPPYDEYRRREPEAYTLVYFACSDEILSRLPPETFDMGCKVLLQLEQW